MIQTNENDTLVFSRIGYLTKAYPARRLKETLIVYLTEESILLNPVIITGNMIIPGLPQIAKQSSWQNTTTRLGTPIPGFQGIETFGPGYVSRGFISKYSKEAQEKKKLKTVKVENEKGKTYVQIINDPEVKEKLMKTHDLSEDEFYHVLEQFNEKNKDIMYDMEPADLIVFLELFFKEHAKK
jgi:hypothetical protein